MARRDRLVTLLAIALVVAAGVVAVTQHEQETHHHDPVARKAPLAESVKRLRAATQDITTNESAAPVEKPPTPEPSNPEWVLDIRDDASAPVPGARVMVVQGDAANATADEHGVARVMTTVSADPNQLRAVIRRDGYLAVEAVFAPTPPESPQVITLRRAAAIAGRVVHADGTGVPGARVLAWSVTAAAPVSVAVQSDKLPTSSEISTCDAGGAFQLDELTPGQQYAIVAAAPGVVSATDPPTLATAGATGVEIRALRVFVAEVELVDESGRPVRRIERVGTWPPPNINLRGLSAPVKFLGASALAAAVSGDPELQQHAALPRTSKVSLSWLITSDSPSESIGPLLFFLNVPGYLPIKTEIHAHPLSAGVLNRITLIELPGIKRGAVQLALRGADAAESASNRVDPAVVVKLMPERPSDDGIQVYEIPVMQDAKTLQIEGFPAGRYRVVEDWALPVGPPPNQWCDVTEGQTTRIEVGREDWSTMSLLVEQASSAHADGPLRVQVGWRIGDGRFVSHDVVFQGAPYVIQFVPRRTYSLAGRYGGVDLASTTVDVTDPVAEVKLQAAK